MPVAEVLNDYELDRLLKKMFFDKVRSMGKATVSPFRTDAIKLETRCAEGKRGKRS